MLAEIVRRKGLSLADVQRMPDRPKPWYVRLTWTDREQGSYRRWWDGYVMRHLGASRERLEREWFWFALTYGPSPWDEHSEGGREFPDLPQRRWLSVARALQRFPERDLEAKR